MKKLLFSVVASLSLAFVHAQADDAYSKYRENGSYYIYTDTANVYTQPDFNSEVIRQYFIGDSVSLFHVGENLTKDYKTAPWCEVVFKAGNAMKKGYMWTGYLSPLKLSEGNVRFVYSLDLKKGGTEPLFTLKAVKEHNIVSTTTYIMHNVEATQRAHDAKIKKPRGLSEFKKMLYFDYSGEACAVPEYQIYVGWDGEKLSPLPLLTFVSDAGAGYYTEKYIFPLDKKGRPGMIILATESGEENEAGKIVNMKRKATNYKVTQKHDIEKTK